jgi:hypothetical protein
MEGTVLILQTAMASKVEEVEACQQQVLLQQAVNLALEDLVVMGLAVYLGLDPRYHLQLYLAVHLHQLHN